MMTTGEGTAVASASSGRRQGTTEAVEAEGGEAFESPDPEEAQPAREQRSPEMPTESEVKSHEVTHCPYRCWCDACVEAFGRERPHPAEGEDRQVPVVHVDYLYQTARGLLHRSELEAEELANSLTVAVMYCGATKFLFAHAVLKKGPGEDRYAADAIARSIGWLGHVRVLLKGDNEPALVLLIDEALRVLRIDSVDREPDGGQLRQVASEGSVPHDPQTNGAAETGVRLLKGQVRAMQLTLERQIGMKIPPQHAIMWWLVRHAAHVRSLLIRGSDGRTAYQRSRGSENRIALAGMGEVVRYKARAKEQGGIANSGWRFSTGVWPGVDHKTNQYII